MRDTGIEDPHVSLRGGIDIEMRFFHPEGRKLDGQVRTSDQTSRNSARLLPSDPLPPSLYLSLSPSFLPEDERCIKHYRHSVSYGVSIRRPFIEKLSS